MRSVIGLDRSLFFDNIVLTLHDYHFVIWRLDINEAIFESAMLKNCQISCGMFSPTRPGLVFIGRTDGRLDIWDFTDQSHQETMNHQVSSSGISCIKFHSSPLCPNILALGDYDGTLHVLELPQMLSKKQANEE
jgi:WD40 repeat protein